MKDVLQNLEYVQLNRYNKTLVHLPGTEVNGLTKTELAVLFAEKLGTEGTFNFTFKYKNDPKVKVTRLRIFFDPSKNNKPALAEKAESKFEVRDNHYIDQSKAIEQMKDVFKLQSEMMQAQIDFYKKQFEFEQTKNKTLNDNSGDTQTDQLQTLLLTQLVGNMFNKKSSVPMSTLKDNVSGAQLPAPVQAVLDQIDYTQIPPEKIAELSDQLNSLIKFKNLPIKKGSE